MLLFVLRTDPVMVVGSFFINHNLVLGETVCSLSVAAPQLFASPLLPCCFAYVCVWVIRVFMPWRFFSSTIETLITAPTLSQASASLSSLYPAPAVLFCQLQVRPALAWYGMWGGGGMPGKHKEIRQELRVGRNLEKWREGASSSYQLLYAPWRKVDLWSESVALFWPLTCTTFVLGNPARERKLWQWCFTRPSVWELQGGQEEELCVLAEK